MTDEGAELQSLSLSDLRAEIRRLEVDLAVCTAQIETGAAEAKRSRRIARGTILTGIGFFGLTLDPISSVIALVGFFDWIEGLRDDTEALNIKIRLRRRSKILQERLAHLESEIRSRGGNI